MNNKVRIFIKVIYYISTFTLGIFLAVYLPNRFMYQMSVDTIYDSLVTKQYDKAMELMGGYFYKTPVYTESFTIDGYESSIVLFDAATLVYKDVEGKQSLEDGRIHSSYAGFVYNVKHSYKSNELKNNKTKLIITNSEGVESTVDIIDVDTDGDGTKDAIASVEEKDFLYLDLSTDYGTRITKLQMIDSFGNLYRAFNFDNFDFSSQFFTDVAPFIEEYNKNVSADGKAAQKEKLLQLHNEFINKNPDMYKVSTYGDFQSRAIKKSMIIVIIYFIAIYVIADLALGKRYLIKGTRWIIVKVFRIKPKQKEVKPEVVFGTNYLCKFTINVNTKDVPDFTGPISIKYSNESGNVEFNLLKGQNYSSTKKIKVGTYMNLWVDINKEYELENIPQNLIVEGYNKELTLKLKKVERNEEN